MLFKSQVTALAFAPILVDNGYLVAFGLKDGTIVLWRGTMQEDKFQWKQFLSVHSQHSHVSTVKRLQWRTKVENPNHLMLLSCSTDFSIRLFSINPTATEKIQPEAKIGPQEKNDS